MELWRLQIEFPGLIWGECSWMSFSAETGVGVA